MRQAAIIFCSLVLALTACRQQQSSTGSQSATLFLKDGTTVAGTVTKSDTASITIQTPKGVTSTYPMAQVASVNYGSTPAPAPNAPPSEPPAQQTSSAPPPPAPPPAAPAPADQQYTPSETFQTIPAGRTIAVRTDQSIDSENAAVGQTYSATVARDVVDSTGQIAIPRRSRATLVVREARGQGKVEGRSELALDVAAVEVGGRRYRLETSDFVEKGRQGVGANQRTAKFAGGGALFGTIIGAVAGGGKGAAIGALSGAAAGTGTQALTRGKNVRIPAETVLNFRLEAPVNIREMR